MDVRCISELQCAAMRSNGTMGAISAGLDAWQKVLQGWDRCRSAWTVLCGFPGLASNSSACVHDIQREKQLIRCAYVAPSLNPGSSTPPDRTRRTCLELALGRTARRRYTNLIVLVSST